jgi:glycosyltransferase involved in cell wall biosynthesis
MKISVKNLRTLWKNLPLWLRKSIMGLFLCFGTRKTLPQNRKTAPGDIVIAGLLGTVSGLGEGVRQLVNRMRALGLDIGTSNMSKVMILDDIDAGPVWSPDYSEGGVLILSLNPNHLPFAYTFIGFDRMCARHVIGIWYWELQNFPKSWKKALACVDELWVGSHYIADGLKKIAGDKPVHVVPLPIDFAPYLAPPTRDPLPHLSGKTIVFFMYDIRSTHARKNPEAVIKAFKLAAHDDPDAALVIKINNSEAWPRSEAILKDLAKDMPNVHFMHEKLSDQDMKNLMARVDIVMSLHRSEGFGLLLAEGMAAAKPVIATGWSANADYMTPESSILIDYKLVPVVDEQHSYDDYDAEWAEPDIGQAAKALRRLLHDPAERARLGQAARKQIMDYLSPENWGKTLPKSFWDHVAPKN